MKLYYIAIVAPEPVFSEVTAIKEYIAAKYHSKHALRSPPHITLVPPFKASEDVQDLLDQALMTCGNTPAFPIILDNFGAFPPRVIFVNVRVSNALLELQESVFRKAREVVTEIRPAHRDYHPHLTVAHRDLAQNAFHKAWEYYRSESYERSWTVQSIHLLEHVGSHWVVYREYGLKGRAR